MAGLMRDVVYSGCRLGIYDSVKELYGAKDPKKTELWRKILAGGTTGGIGSFFANPTDLVKVRMMADIKGTRYNNTFAAFREIYVQGGIRGLYRGSGPTVARAAAVNAAEIPAYDHFKHFLINEGFMEEGYKLHIVASFLAGFIATVVSSPLDVVKSRIMNMDAQKYSSSIDCAVQTIKTEGIYGLYKGFFPNWFRMSPHVIITFFTLEKLRSYFGIRPF